MPSARARSRTQVRSSHLAWHQSLLVKLGLVFALLIILLGTAALLAGRLLVGDKLVAETFRYETESGRRLLAEFKSITQRAEEIAGTLAKLGVHTPGGPWAVKPPIPLLVDRGGGARLITGVGIWPEPHGLDPARDRASLYWVRDASGQLHLREDYNDVRTVPYYKEKWYTPARFAQEDRCFWTPVYREPLAKREVITCAMPMRSGNRFLGVVTASISLDSIAHEFATATADDLGYSLLVDSDNRLLAVSPDAAAVIEAGERPRNLAELAQKLPSFNPVALALHKQDEDLVSSVARSPLYNAAEVSALREQSRDMSRAEAEAALTQVWSVLGGLNKPQPPQHLELLADPVLGDDAFAVVFQAPESFWRLVRVTPAKQGFSGARYVFQQSLLVTGGVMVLTLVLIFSFLRYLVIGPLRQMTQQIAAAETAEDALHVVLDESARNEVGVLAYWHNERTRELREMMERTLATNSQLVMESDERRAAQEQLARVQERATLALQSVADAVITTDEKGAIEDMNPVAESLTGVSVRAGRGKSLAEVFSARLGGANGAPLPNIAEVAIQRGTRLDYAEGVQLSSFGGAQRDIALSVTPIRTRANRIIGAIIVFREKTQRASDAAPAVAKKSVDALTGLPGRDVCDRRIRSLIEAARLNPRRHALLMVDVDHLKRINETGGHGAGDEVLAKVGETLSTKTGSAGEVFRLHADQFVVLLNNSDLQRSRVFAEALRETLANTRMYWESKYFGVTASFGVADFDGSEESPVEVLRRGDDACAAAKRSGRNTVKVYDDSMNRAGREADDATWVRRIRAGLDHNMFHLTTQFILPLQAHASEGRVFEVLLALEDEEGFWAAPSAFMPVAERQHLSAEMDRWVVSRLLKQLDKNPEVLAQVAMVNINLSAGSLIDAGLIEFLALQLEQHRNVHPRKLCFELREDDAAEHPQQAQMLADALRSLGCRVAVEHFLAREPSRLALLRKLPADFVKINAQQFRSISADGMEQMLAESLVKLARSLRKRVMVGNIDDNAQLEAWRRFGVDYMQGFVVAKPSPVVFQTPY